MSACACYTVGLKTWKLSLSLNRSLTTFSFLEFSILLETLDFMGASKVMLYSPVCRNKQSSVCSPLEGSLFYYNSLPHLMSKHLLRFRRMKWCSKHHMCCCMGPVGSFVMCAEYPFSFSFNPQIAAACLKLDVDSRS